MIYERDVAQLLAYVEHGTIPDADSVADVLASASSPMWSAEGTVRGAWAVALADAALPGARAGRTVGQRLASGTNATRKQRQVGGEFCEPVKWLAAGNHGGPQKRGAARAWLAARPVEQSMVDWLGELADSSGAQAAWEERAAAVARERRAARKAADVATGGARSWRTPEEFAVMVLGRVPGGAPVDLETAREWLGLVADAVSQISGKISLAQADALRAGVARVLVRAGLDPEKAAAAAHRAVPRPVVDFVPAVIAPEPRRAVRFEPVGA